MSMALVEFAEKLVPISDFSQGKAGKIFSEVGENNNEDIVLKNNQPTAVVMSIKEYVETQKKVSKLEKLFEQLENIKLLQLAENRDSDKTTSLEDFITEEGFSMNELEEL